MELVLILAALYLLQSVEQLSPAATLLRRRGGEYRWRRGPRFGWVNLLPSRMDLVVERVLPTEWMHSVSNGAGEADTISVRNRRVVIAGRPLFHLSTAGGASHLRTLLRAAADGTRAGEPAADGHDFVAFLDRALTATHGARRIDEAVGSTRMLGTYASLYMLFAFVGLPVFILMLGEAIAWVLFLPPLAILHVAGVVELWRVHRELDLPREERSEDVLMAALYPPSLFRARHELVQGAVATVHPAAAVAVLTGRDSVRSFLSGELAFVEGHLATDTPLLAREKTALERLVRSVGWSPHDLLAPLLRSDAASLAYCPWCDDDFVRELEVCPDCGSVLVGRPGAVGVGGGAEHPEPRRSAGSGPGSRRGAAG